MITNRNKRQKRHRRVRAKIKGTSERPRFSVFRSNKHLWIQLIDDDSAITMVSCGDKDLLGKDKKTESSMAIIAKNLGEFAAKKAKEKGMERVVFDRGGYAYHGIIKSVAEGARKGGLKL